MADRLAEIRDFDAALKASDDSLVVVRRADFAYLLALADALARLVEFEPLAQVLVTHRWQCRLCAGEGESEATVVHYSNCPWRQARELLGGKVEA